MSTPASSQMLRPPLMQPLVPVHLRACGPTQSALLLAASGEGCTQSIRVSLSKPDCEQPRKPPFVQLTPCASGKMHVSTSAQVFAFCMQFQNVFAAPFALRFGFAAQS